MLGFDRVMTNTLFSLSEDFSAIIVLSGYIFKAYLKQFADFFCVLCNFNYELVVWQVLEEVLF
jgi:hypothetical protein